MSPAQTVLTATRRAETGKAVARLRKAGQIPGVVFGHGLDSIPVTMDAHEFDHLRKTIHSNTIITLSLDGKEKMQVMVHGMRIDPRHRLLQHVDLFALKSGEEVTVEVPIHTTGESYAVVRLGGTLLHNVDHVRVRALPEKLPEALTFSIESLTEFDMQIHLREVELPEGVTLLSDPDEVVAKVIAPRVEEVAAPTEEAAEEAAPAADAKAADKD